jgi:hypothetical protein
MIAGSSPSGVVTTMSGFIDNDELVTGHHESAADASG